MEQLPVTVITVVYNGAATLGRAMQSVLEQDYENIEYIVIDGASQDHTREVIRSFQPAFDAASGKKLIWLSEPDKGMYDALNKGARMAHGEIVGQINSDDRYEPNAISVMAELYRKEPYDIAWADGRILKGERSIVKRAFIGRLWTTAGFVHPTMFSRRDVLLAFPYQVDIMDADFDMVTRAKLAGKQLRVTHGVLADYSLGGMSTRKSLGDMKKRIAMKYATYRRHGFSRLYWFYCFGMEFAKFVLG